MNTKLTTSVTNVSNAGISMFCSSYLVMAFCVANAEPLSPSALKLSHMYCFTASSFSAKVLLELSPRVDNNNLFDAKYSKYKVAYIVSNNSIPAEFDMEGGVMLPVDSLLNTL